ncbi:MAG: DNA mismatch repair endonuclease MutL [Oscillospiraceae bacterium]|jgi:DNA mismatch repair protein MutL|nr:DNA mismatch repair endonuclease MutL [Oscillospiraceae bacterium]
MAIINRLSPKVADMIAAGEVVDRPASVIKELIENSIDADARSVTAEIRRGGMSYMRVTDDGNGMSPEDALTAFLRHATSKLHDERGLESIKTLGFRGEALAAISAVSRVELKTREREADSGVIVTLEGGSDTGNGASPVGCPYGTTIVVQDLFFNTPARFKFMKTDNAEGAACVNAALRQALSHPELAFRMIKDGTDTFSTNGSGDVRDTVYALLGRDFALGLTDVPENGDETMSITGLVTRPNTARGNRTAQYFFVNGRYVKSQMLSAALERAFVNILPGGRFPGCVLYIKMRENLVDVNVHPAKTEVKFMFERAVFDLVHYSAKGAISGRIAQPVRAEHLPNPPSAPTPPLISESVSAPPRNTTLTGTEPSRTAQNLAPMPEPINATRHQEIIRELYQRPEQSDDTRIPIPAQTPDYKYIGEAYGGYIILELPSELLFIDKHAAHERILFDRLKAREHLPMPQILIVPSVIEPGREDAALVLDNLPILEGLGFSIDDFGNGALAVRQVPSDIELSDIAELIAEVAESIRLGDRPGNLSREDEILSTVACKAAIKLGKNSDPREFTPLIAAVMSGQITHCPHGRPVVFRLSRDTIEKAIKRK